MFEMHLTFILMNFIVLGRGDLFILYDVIAIMCLLFMYKKGIFALRKGLLSNVKIFLSFKYYRAFESWKLYLCVFFSTEVPLKCVYCVIIGSNVLLFPWYKRHYTPWKYVYYTKWVKVTVLRRFTIFTT